MRKRNRMLRFGFVVAIVAVVGLIATDAWSQVGREKALVEKAAVARTATAPIANANVKRERETVAPVKRAPAEVAVGGITREERVARHNKLHARLIAEMPDDALNDPISVELTKQDRADLAGPYKTGTPLLIGVVKAISPAIRFGQGMGFDGVDTQETADGGFVWAVTVTSPDAEAIRVHFTNFSLPPHAEIFFFSPDGAVDGPFVGTGRNGNGDFWSRSLSSDTGVIQLRVSGKGALGARQEISFAVSELAHIHDRKHLEPDEGRGHDTWPCSDNAVCLVDANCVSGNPADPAKDAVAKMEWISGPSVFTCSGGLLADTVPASQIPYFLTANHCMSASIANLETWFNYTTDSCNGICPHNILTGGAPPSDTIGFTVLASSATSDFTLGTLDQAPPAGALFLGWNNSPVAFTNGAKLHRISNANFGPQVYSQQDVDTGSPICGGIARGNFIYSDTNTGGTMGGSSGSPVVNAASEVVGQLFGCCGFNCADECASAPTNWTVDGAFAVTFPSVEEFLDPPTDCTTDPDCDDADPCTTDTCSGGFCSNTPISCPPGEICVGGVCEGAGACCVGTTCTIETVSDCAASGGTYQGNGSPCGSGQAGDPTIYTSSPNVSIPDGGGPGNPATDTINVTDSVIIGDVDVDLDITHTWVGDLTVLVSHLGTTVTVVDRPGVPASTFGCNLDNYQSIILDDEGTGGTIEDACLTNLTSPPNYTPNNPLSAFDGMDSAGVWTITVYDSATPDPGTLNRWSLHIDAVGNNPCTGCTTNADCDDGLFCNGAETCVASVCQAGTPPNCNDGVGCTDDSCNEGTDSCDSIANNANCDDGLFCNGAETCSATLDCQAGTAPNCNDGVGCTDDSCNEGTDSCDNIANNANCDDALFCNGAETCNATLDCQAGTAVNCDDGVGCTDDSCNEGTDSCDNIANNANCDDGLFCNGAETCNATLDCQAGTAVNCNDGVGCTDDSCNEGTDSCDNIANNANCDDGLFCNGAETCNATLDCQAGTAVNCNDGVGCTDDSCNEGTDSCDNIANNANCDDGLFCNGAETCSATLDCQSGTAVNCDDGVGCTDDSCNEGTDSCDNIANNANCDDGLFCNGAETCNATLDCQAGSDPCPGQICDEGTDTCNDCITNGDCDDGLFCNGAETCVGGVCQAGTAVNCNDGVGCTDDSCNEGTDSCDNIANNANCDDGLFCNGSETCSATLDCQAGTAVNCNDGVGCTDDSCNEGTDSCDNIANNANCDDGLFCNGSETCSATLDCQAGTAVNCNDGVGCTDDSCNEGTDSCDNIANNANCPDDGLFCNGTESCDSVNDCVSSGDPCPGGTTCNETTDTCDAPGCDNDGTCESGEDCNTCPNDCFTGSGGFCGDGICAGSANGEDCFTCSADCRCAGPGCNACCGDGFCGNNGEKANNCPVDCDPGFVPPSGSTCCGDGTCEGTENLANCAIDCGCTTAADCDDGVACTIDDCVAGACQATPDNGACPDDGQFCNGTEFCDAGSDCSSTGNPCGSGETCNETTDTCDPCTPKNGNCASGADCCSGICKNNGRCR